MGRLMPDEMAAAVIGDSTTPELPKTGNGDPRRWRDPAGKLWYLKGHAMHDRALEWIDQLLPVVGDTARKYLESVRGSALRLGRISGKQRTRIREIREEAMR